MKDNSLSEFSTWRRFLWPIHSFELKKLLPMFFMMFFISFNYTVLRDIKDSIVVNAPGSGAEAIPILKMVGVLPAAIIFFAIYGKLANILTRDTLFYVTILPFLLFFILFSQVLHPNASWLHFNESADWLLSVLPAGFSGAIAVYRNWTVSLFYIFSELWGTVGISLLFWGYANQTTRASEAKRFYATFGLGANAALPLAGIFVRHFSNPANLEGVVDQWSYTLNRLTVLIVVGGLIVMSLYYYLNNVVLKDPRFAPKTGEVKAKKKKMKMTIMESVRHLAQSRYILHLTVLVASYGILINMYEVTWKGQLKLAYPTQNEYTHFMGFFSATTGIVSVFMVLFVGGNVIRNLGWTVAALATPLVLISTGTLFLIFIIFKDSLASPIAALGTTPLALAVAIGTIQNIMSKSTKYSLFDPTKEMAFIPLDEETKVKGKAAVDVIGARAGKSAGSIIQNLLIWGFGSLSAITPFLAVLCFVAGVFWIRSVKILSKDFHEISEKRRLEAEAEAKNS